MIANELKTGGFSKVVLFSFGLSRNFEAILFQWISFSDNFSYNFIWNCSTPR